MVRKRDRFWQYAKQMDVKFICNFCDRKFAGGVSRIKSHLSGIKCGGIDICTEVPEDVRVAAAESISGPNKRVKAEARSSKTKEILPKMLMSKDGVMLDELLANFILLNDVDSDIVQRPSFINLWNAVAEHGSHYALPCRSVVETKLVPDLVQKIEKHVDNVRKSWDTTGCTLMTDIWSDEERSFINIFAHSNRGMVLLNALEIPRDKLSHLLWEIVYFVIEKIGPNNVLQYITHTPEEEGLFRIMPRENHRHVYETNCVGQEIHLLFNEIYDDVEWVVNSYEQARAVVTEIHKSDGILSSMKQLKKNWQLEQSTKFYSDYYMLQSLMEVESELQSLVSSSEWLLLSLENDDSGVKVGEIIRSSEFWSEGKEVLRTLKPILQVLRLVDSCGATSGFLYAAMKMADESIRQKYNSNVQKYQRLWDIFQLRQSNIIQPVHAAAAFLNPAYMCCEKFEMDCAMKDGIDSILERLVGSEEKEIFVREMMRYHEKESKLFTYTAMTMLRTSHPCDWWSYCGDVLPVLKKYAIRILSQPCSTSSCRQSMSAFETAQIKKRKPLMPAVTDNYLYWRTNALLMENFNAIKEEIRKPLDLEKLDELPDFTDVDGDFTRDLLDESKVPLSYGKLNFWSTLARKDGETEKKDLRLHFMTKLPTSLVKGNVVKSEKGTPIHVILVDSSTGSVVLSGPSSVLKLTVVVIRGDFDEDANKCWTREDFGSYEIVRREGETPLLTGDPSVKLDKGMGTLGAITVEDVPSWTRSGKFRLGVKIASGYCEGIRIHEGISSAFTVEDVRRADPNIYGERIWRVEIAPVDAGDTLSQSSSGERFVRSLLKESSSTEVDETKEPGCSIVSDAVSVVHTSCLDGDLHPSSVRDRD